MIFVFKCTSGLGNRLCNLMNMFYLHSVYPQATYYVVWLINPHCSAPLADLINLSEYSWIRYDYRTRPAEFYAQTSIQLRTRWDVIGEWTRHPIIVSVTHHMYAFVPLPFCIDLFTRLRYTPAVHAGIEDLKRRYGVDRKVIHFRSGDLLHLLEGDAASLRRISEKVKRTEESQDLLRFEYNQMIVNRSRNAVIESFSELLFLAKHCVVVAYCPYSWFSSWAYLLNRQYRVSKPVFDSRVVDLVLAA